MSPLNIHEQITTYANNIKELNELSTERQAQLYQTALIATTGFLGILLSLQPISTPLPRYIRVVFLAALVLLTLGCLSIAIILYDHSMLFERVKKAYTEESENALRERRHVSLVTVGHLRRTKILSRVAPISVAASLLFLLIYSFLALL